MTLFHVFQPCLTVDESSAYEKGGPAGPPFACLDVPQDQRE